MKYNIDTEVGTMDLLSDLGRDHVYFLKVLCILLDEPHE